MHEPFWIGRETVIDPEAKNHLGCERGDLSAAQYYFAFIRIAKSRSERRSEERTA